MADNISEAVEARGITEVLHFTTSNGLLGILNTGKLLSHSQLKNEEQLSHIMQINCPDRSRDRAWHGYVNLSISRINGSFFSISQNKWHAKDDIFWCILSFSPEIMTHEAVLFSTTNNAYDMTQRAPGLGGFESLFASQIRLFPTKWANRSKATSDSHTTCNQAEVLYPIAVPLEYLRTIYLSSHEHLHEVEAQMGLCVPELIGKFQLIVAPELFS
jgi:hypothetical protein